ncbi:MAG: hypothetical protein QOH41_2614 [Blastocatellia bacterium]|nr:hypothetical protein [Blastocatellia bacterium]
MAIDDDVDFLENFKAWIPEEVADQDSAGSTSGAVELLRQYRYNLVLLDLSMDPHNPSNRENRAIQEYLATKPEGTLYIVVSGVAQKGEVRDSAFYLGAYDVIFKAEIEPGMLLEKVKRAIEATSKNDEQFLIDAKRRLLGDPKLEDQILKVLSPKGGAGGMYPMMDVLLTPIAPIASHENRPRFEIHNDSVVGLVWSRRLGKALSIVLANRQGSTEKEIRDLGEWLGYPQSGKPILTKESFRVRMNLFEEPNIRSDHFGLPLIPQPTVHSRD